MQSDSSSSADPDPAPSTIRKGDESGLPPVMPSSTAIRKGEESGLPPVTPPSTRHIVQMFVVPGVIVGGVVLLGLMCSGVFSYFTGLGFARTPEAFIARLEDRNPDIRWRAANDLVQVLKRDDDLASNPALAFKLAELLSQELDQIAYDEKTLAERAAKQSAQEQIKERNQLKARRDYVRFLSASLANLTLPVGVPVLTQLARSGGSSDPKNAALMRRHAVWMLANLGENLKRFQGDPSKGYPGLPQEKRDKAMDEIRQEAENGSSPRRHLAEQCLQLMDGKRERGVIAALAECARSDDPDLRKYVAFALTFWDGSSTENALAEQTLIMLARDDGRGTRILLEESD